MKKFFKFILMSLGALVLLIIAVAIFTGGGEEEKAVEKVGGNNTEETASTEEEAPAEDEIFKVGDSVKVEGVVVTVQKAEYIPASEYSAPEKGKVLQLTVNAVNESDSEIYFDSSSFNLYDSEGNSLEQYFGIDGMDVSGDVDKGRKITGTITYDVPEATNYELIYKPTFSWKDTKVTFDIQPQ